MNTAPLGKLVTITIGKTPPRGDHTLWDRDKEGDNAWLSIRDLQVLDGREAVDSSEYISDEGARLFKPVPRGTLLVSFKLTLGRLAFAGRDIYTNEAIAALHNDEKTITNEYLYYYLSYFDWHEYAKSDMKVKGLTLNKAKLYALPVIYPESITEQRRVVKILDSAFEKIDRGAKLLEENLINAREIFHAELTKLFEQGHKWDEKYLSQVGVIERGKSKHRPRNDPSLYGGDYPFVQTGDVRNSEHFITNFRQTYNQKGLAQSKLWPKGTLCITIAANIAETAILSFDACFPDSIIGFIPHEGDVKFYEYLITYHKDVLQAKSKGSAQDNINLGTFQSTPFRIPGITEQNDIVAKLDAADLVSQKLQALYQHKLEGLAELKQSLLHKAFKGDL